ncbi:small acid-soluble spore protein SspJ [Bacillus sp. SL00103]
MKGRNSDVIFPKKDKKAKNERPQASRSAVRRSKQELAGDPLQEAVQKKKNNDQ